MELYWNVLNRELQYYHINVLLESNDENEAFAICSMLNNDIEC